ncbi:hypothetical protein CMV_000842 [Castanea mollissima]|uniref:Uncharacterized protein n=1 Tax=Castanea mollissima TaxID=60419 RepID=A0A8J4S107_9ROSI|nr:hypothetical protein CMV_000842 [Castanea mollissima]
MKKLVPSGCILAFSLNSNVTEAFSKHFGSCRYVVDRHNLNATHEANRKKLAKVCSCIFDIGTVFVRTRFRIRCIFDFIGKCRDK